MYVQRVVQPAHRAKTNTQTVEPLRYIAVVVRVERIVKHKRYKRYVRRSARFMAHDENGVCKVGDTVEIVESRPLSARKRWRVSRVVRSTAESATVSAEAAE